MAYPYNNQPYGGYGGGAPPPPQQYGYGAPPPQQHHHHQHHQHHHQHGGYGAPPPQQPYGGGYAPPPPQPGYGGGYGAPPPPMNVGGGNFYLGVPIPAPPGQQPSPPPPGFNAQLVVDNIRKATKGFGTDEKMLIQTLAPLDAMQIDATSHQFRATVGKDLITVLEKETSGYFEGSLRAKCLGPLGYDVWLVNRACQGAGTHEDLLNEVLLCRTNSEIWLLKQAYRATYSKDMVKVVEGELSMKTKRMFVMALEGTRMDDNAPVDHNLVEQDAREIFKAARGAGTDEIKICGIMIARSTPHLQALNQAYQHHHRKSLADMVNSEFSGHMKDALLYIANTALPGPPGISRDAHLLEESMKGMGTKDERLIYRVMRAHWNRGRFEELKRAYAATQHRKGLQNRVEGETSGDYKRFMSAVIGP